MIKTMQPALHGAQHLADGSDPIPGIGGLPDPAGGDTVAGLVLATSPAGFWKLNESSGTTAFDSSGNGHDMTPQSGFNPPTWGQAAGPPGDTTALWPVGGTQVGEHVTITPALTNNFTAGIWAKALSGAGAVAGELIGQGTSHHVGGASTGWGLYLSTTSGILGEFDNGGSIASNAHPSLDTWYFVALVRDAGTWKLYVNGILQTATSTTSPGTGSTDTWIGNDNWPGHGSYAQSILLSYAFITPAVVSGADLLAIYDAGALGPAGILAGKVWTAIGDGTADWADSTVQVQF